MPRKVLVADDSVTIQKVVGITFAAEDITLSFVDNGDEAIELAKQIKPDLIIADVLMPRKSGYEVCEAIKRDPELAHIPVLLLTGTFEPFDAELSRRVGADGTITKPFESQTLIRQVKELLNRAAPAKTIVLAPAESVATLPSEAPSEMLEEADFAFADLSRDLQLEPIPSELVASTTPAEPVMASPPPSQDAEEPLDFAFKSSGDFSFAVSTTSSANADAAGTVGSVPRLSEREDEFEFMEEPGEMLELGDPAQTTRVDNHLAGSPSGGTDVDRPWGAGQPPATEAPSEAALAPEETAEVWDLSGLEAMEEQVPAEPVTPVEEPEDPTFWDDAAAEAIDLVESGSIDAPEEALLLPEEDTLDSALAGADALLLAAEGEDLNGLPGNEPLFDIPGEEATTIGFETGEAEADAPRDEFMHAIGAQAAELSENADLDLGFDAPRFAGDLPLTAIDEAESLLEPAEADSGGPLHSLLKDLPEFDFDGAAGGEPIEDLTDFEPEVAVVSSDATVRALTNEPPTTTSALSELGESTVQEVVRRSVNDAVERVTWEAFSDLSETVVKAVREKVEQIAWEVIPQMAEALIKEEIKRIQSEEKK